MSLTIKVECQIDSGFNSKGQISEIEIVDYSNEIVQYRMADSEGALYNPIVHISKEFFDKKFKKI
jgi:hypothetical protein